jgi:hypothetical protein
VCDEPKSNYNNGIFVVNFNGMKEMDTKPEGFWRYLLIISNQECPGCREPKFSIIREQSCM